MDRKHYYFNIKNPSFDTLGYIIGTANIEDKHDRSAPSDYHWKILKCRMIIFSSSSVIACPDKTEVKRVHIIFNKESDDYDKINSMFWKYSLTQDGAIRAVTAELFEMCFQYTMIARIAPIWNALGNNYLINNRDFLITKGAQEGLRYQVKSNDQITTLDLTPVKINLLQLDADAKPGEYVRVLPSLNKATVEECYNSFPVTGNFKSYKDLRRHWKNICTELKYHQHHLTQIWDHLCACSQHGYRLPEVDSSVYYLIQFWRGNPLTYPKYCLTRNFPIVSPIPRSAERIILSRFIHCLKTKMANMLRLPFSMNEKDGTLINQNVRYQVADETLPETLNVSLCTPTQG